MEHVVFFPGADGAEAFRRAADLDEAVRLVESLRNDQGIGDVSVFALSAVPLAFRTYVHVELPVSDEAPAEPSFEAPVEPSFEAPAEPSFEAPAEPSIPPPPFEAPPPFDAPESFEAPAPLEFELPTPPPPPSDFFEPIEEFEALAEPEVEAEPEALAEPELEAELEADAAPEALAEPEVEAVPEALAEPELEAVPEAAEPESFFEPEAQEWDHSEADVAWADNENWSEAEPVSDDVWFEPAVAEVAELVEVAESAEPQESAPIAVPEFFQSAEELPPLTLAPGPLLFDGDGAPLASSGSYDLVEEAPAELTDLIPADFTDLIPKDIPHGDLARHTDEVPAEAPYEAPYEVQVAEEQVAEAPATDELPPMDVTEIPSDVSSIEAFEANPIPAAREAVEEPAPVHDGPRGLGFFGG